MKYDRLEAFDTEETPETWLWCLHCERCYQLKDIRIIKHPFLKNESMQMCHYPDCDGDSVIDAWNWDNFRARAQERDLPEVPEIGVGYPMYEE